MLSYHNINLWKNIPNALSNRVEEVTRAAMLWRRVLLVTCKTKLDKKKIPS